MIMVNGNQFRTLKEPLYVNGTRVQKVMVNNKRVYPEGSDYYLLKVLGFIQLDLNHNEYGEGLTTYAANKVKYTYLPGDHSYKVKACFSLVVKTRVASYVKDTDYISPLNWPNIQCNLIFDYDFGEGIMLPTGYAVHPLLGCPGYNSSSIWWDNDNKYSIELLVHLNITPPPVCAWTSPGPCYPVGSYPFYDLTATPITDRLQEPVDDANGLHWFESGKYNSYIGGWTEQVQSGRTFTFLLRGKTYYYGRKGVYLQVGLRGNYNRYNGYPAKYRIVGTNRGEIREVEVAYAQYFNFVNIPITDFVFCKPEWLVPEEERHPRVEDLQYFINKTEAETGVTDDG